MALKKAADGGADPRRSWSMAGTGCRRWCCWWIRPITGARGPGSATRAEAEGGPPAAGSPGDAVAQRTHEVWIKQGYTEPGGCRHHGGQPRLGERTSRPGVRRQGHVIRPLPAPRRTSRQYAEMLRPIWVADASSEDQQEPIRHLGDIAAGTRSRRSVLLSRPLRTPADAATIWTRDFGVPGEPTEVGRRARGAGRYGHPAGFGQRLQGRYSAEAVSCSRAAHRRQASRNLRTIRGWKVDLAGR